MFNNKSLILEYPSISIDKSYLDSFLLTSKINLSGNKNESKFCLFKNNEFLITLNEYNIFNKIVSKYYPKSEDLITISSENGLNILDINKEEFIYNYNDSIYNHLYIEMDYDDCSKIIALTENGFKLFDLRSRQSILSINFKSIKDFQINKLKNNPLLYFNTEKSIFKYNIKDLIRTSKTIPEKLIEVYESINTNNNIYFEEQIITDFSICNNKLGFIFKDKNKFFFNYNNSIYETKHNKICKGYLENFYLYSNNNVSIFKNDKIIDYIDFSLKESIKIMEGFNNFQILSTNKFTYKIF